MEPLIKNWSTIPPRGGWRIDYTIGGRKATFSGSPTKVVHGIAAFQKNNGVFHSIADVWRYCNVEWCKREPNRCTMKTRDQVAADPEWNPVSSWGPDVWLAFNKVPRGFDAIQWQSLVNYTHTLLDPNESPTTGCRTCFFHWSQYITRNPPQYVTDEASAAHWIYKLHDEVNARLEKPRPSFEEVARKFDWKV